MRSFLPASLLFFSALVHLPARAEDCGNVTAKGVCLNAKTVVFCEDGELEEIRCQSGELCAFDDDRFSGAAGCIATRYAGCGAVPEVGLCAGSTLLYCANGRVEELECPSGTSCQPVSQGDTVDFDCVAGTGNEASGGEDPDDVPVEPEDSDNVDNPTPVATGDGAPLPSVQKGGAGPAADYEAGGGSCASGGLGLPAFAGLMLLALLSRVRVAARCRDRRPR